MLWCGGEYKKEEERGKRRVREEMKKRISGRGGEKRKNLGLGIKV
jgi:hypothetical protein